MEAALIDANTGSVLRLPQIPGGEQHGFDIPIEPPDLSALRFRTNSRLLGVPFIGDSFTYYYVLEHGRWRFLSKLPTPDEQQ
jgi:hypothetical protein